MKTNVKTNEVPTVSVGTAGSNRAPFDLNYLAARLSARDKHRQLLSLLTGKESDEELRAMALQFVEACPVSCRQNRCPFRILGNLYHVSSKALINSMGRSGLVSLFEADVDSRQCAIRSPDALTDP
jgi:hypothetical protein